MDKTIGIIGLGLIGGSLAKAIKKHTNHKVMAMDHMHICQKAIDEDVIQETLTEDNIHMCDIIIFCLYPSDTIKYAKKYLPLMKKGCILMDCTGIKESVCVELSKECNMQGRYFVGGHPMAGIEKSGYNHSTETLYENATMIFCQDEFTNLVALKSLELLFKDLGFSKITITNAEEHDKIIAFTSQLAHVVSNAYVRSEQAKSQMGFSAGSYKDLTRVAYLNEIMWSELFLENKRHLSHEIRTLSQRLDEYATAIEENDKEKLIALLIEGKKAKEVLG